MRYIPVSSLREGMTLALPLYGVEFSVLMDKNSILNAQSIQRINDLGYAGVYVDDEISRDIKPHHVIPDEIKMQTIRLSKELLTQIENNEIGKGVRIPKARQEKIIMPVVSSIMSCSNRIIDLVDVKPFDAYTHYHTAEVVVLSVLIGAQMGLFGAELYELGLSSLLHDVGNVFVPKEILNKPGKLTPEEFETVKQHTHLGFDYLREHFDISIEGCLGALHHHEYYNGGGYPYQLKKDKISIYGRIVALADVFDALTSRRPFRQPMLPSTAIDYIEMNSGIMFDPEVVEAFKSIQSFYPSGTCVELDSGVSCIVTENTNGHSERPKTRLLNGLSTVPLYVELNNNPLFRKINISHVIEN